MKIILIVPGRWHAFDLARELHQEGSLYRLITTYPKSRTRLYGVPDDKVISFGWMVCLERVLQRFLGMGFWQKFCAQSYTSLFSYLASRHIKEAGLVHGWSGSSESAFLRAKRLGIPCVLERSSSHMHTQCRLLRAEYPKYQKKWIETSPRIVARELREYALADQIFVPSKFVFDSFIENEFPVEKLFKSSFGADLSHFKYERKEYNQNSALRCIFTSARSIRKGICYLASAFEALDQGTAELTLVGGQEKGIEAFLPKGDAVTIHSHVPQVELINFYRRADVFIHPSIEEGLACVQAQALASGLALICTTNTGGETLLMLSNKEPIQMDCGILQYPAGFVVPVCDASAISTCIKILSTNRSLLEQMQREASLLSERGNSWADYAKRNKQQYRRLIDRNNQASF